jgi:hypothetical protein
MTLPHNLQQSILESEGVEFSPKGKCDLTKYLWYPEGHEPGDDAQPSLLA